MAGLTFPGITVLACVLMLVYGYVLTAVAILVTCAVIFYVLPRKTPKVDPNNKAVFITGCDHGFGQHLAKRLSQKGFLVFAGCLFPEKEGAKNLKAECPDNLHVVPVDVTDEWQVRGAVKYVKENIGDNVLWAVVNNAGIAVFSEIEWCPTVQFQRILEVNVLGVVRVTKAFLPLVRKCNGRIVNVASLAGRFTFPAFAAYSMSKKACIAFSDGLRIEMSKFNVNVITIEPGLYKTPIAECGYLEEQNRKSWSECPPEVKDVYGEEYFDAFLSSIGDHMKRARPNIFEVIDLMENAVMDVVPKIRYIPKSSVVVAFFLEHLPSSLTDGFFRKYGPKTKPRLSSTGSASSGASDNDVRKDF